ncbi:cox cluster protein [Halosimplex aquaticum]|uniref:Cox cluster protein n=1 Tax=Halosimplex aquaticum TaxID=3026162 RepID=A0ABD5XZP8_9EURY|nr:cox cluster protein [Halosimplex aquaticum]
MEEQPGLSDQYRTASPWPLLVAVGFALSEVGVFLGVFPVAVGGVLLLGASVAGILAESGYARRPWRTLAALGLAFTALGAVVVATQVSPSSVDILGIIADPTGITGRGMAVAVAGVMLVVAGGVSQAVGRNHGI